MPEAAFFLALEEGLAESSSPLKLTFISAQNAVILHPSSP